MDELATTEPSDDQSLESKQLEYVTRQLAAISDLLRRYSNEAEQKLIPALLNPEQAADAAYWAQLSGTLHAGIALALARTQTIRMYLEEGDVPGGHDHLPSPPSARDPE
jgi:hypothetical protein